METVHIYQLQPTKKLFVVLRDAQMEAAKVWNFCVEAHKQARREHLPWPGRNELQKATKGGQFALHSQSVQMVVHAFLANIDTTRKLRQTHPEMRMNYPWQEKMLLSGQMACSGCNEEQGMRCSAYGQRAQVHHPASLLSTCRFLVPSRIYALVYPGVVVGQTRPWHHLMLVVYHSQRVNHCSWSRSLRGQATPLECDRSSPPQRRVESVTICSILSTITKLFWYKD